MEKALRVIISIEDTSGNYKFGLHSRFGFPIIIPQKTTKPPNRTAGSFAKNATICSLTPDYQNPIKTCHQFKNLGLISVSQSDGIFNTFIGQNDPISMTEGKRNLWLILAGFILVGVLSFYGIFGAKFTYRVHSRGISYPNYEWSVTRTSSGDFITTLKDYRSGQTSSRNLSEYLRGDEARFVFSPGLQSLGFIEAGDTIGSIQSEEESFRLRSLEGDLRIEEATLGMVKTGSKPAQREEANKRLELAKLEHQSLERAYQRAKKLFADSLISATELNNSFERLQIGAMAIQIAEASLQNISSGEKSEQVEVIRAKIKSLSDQIAILKRRQSGFTLVAPVNGQLIRKKDVLAENHLNLSVVDTGGFVVLIPVPLFESHWIKPGNEVVIRAPGSGYRVMGKVLSLDNSVQILNGKQSLFVTAGFDYNPAEIMPGEVTRAAISCDLVTPWIFLKRVFQFYLH